MRAIRAWAAHHGGLPNGWQHPVGFGAGRVGVGLGLCSKANDLLEALQRGGALRPVLRQGAMPAAGAAGAPSGLGAFLDGGGSAQSVNVARAIARNPADSEDE